MIAPRDREALLRKAQELLRKNPDYSYADLAVCLRSSPATVFRLMKRGAATQTHRCGRKPRFALTGDEVNALRNHVLAKDSLRLGIEDWLAAQPSELEHGTRALLQAILDRAAQTRKHTNWPLAIRRAGHLSPEMKAKLRGPKHFLDVEHCDRRGLFYLDEQGQRIDLRPNTIWESDDMSLNQPFVFQDPDTGEMQMGRQTLCTLDVFSAAWLGVTPIGRARDAYRVTDIADHLWSLVQQFGLPEIWRIERGVWENSFIFGIEIAPDVMWGGLEGVMKIDPGFTSRHKALIESSFNHFQRVMAHASRDIGRSRGEFERDSNAFARGDTRGFWQIEAGADGMADGMRRCNGETKDRHGFRQLVVPEELYSTATKVECPADKVWLFRPVKKMATVRKGHVEISVDHYPLPFRFRVNGVDDALYLEHGYRVLVAFHPGRPHEGCWIFNRETGAKNAKNFKLAQQLLLAPLAEDAPQVCYAKSEQQFLARRKAAAAVRQEFRAIMAVGKQGRKESVSQDSYGNSTRVEITGSLASVTTSQQPGNSSAVGDTSLPTLNRAEAPVILNGRDAGTPSNNRATEHLVARPGVAAPFVTDDFDSRVKDADAFEEKLRATGALT